MDTILLQINNNKAYKLIQDLEDLDIVKILQTNSKPQESLSKKFADSLNLTDEQYEQFQQSVVDGRDEWERNI